jgi:N-acetylmuramoyl-L-alanine amidase
MRLALVCWCLVTLALAAGASRALASPAVLSRVHLLNHTYLRVNDWAKASGLELRWLKRDESLQLSNRSTRIVLNLDSRQAEVNGVQVWLSFAPVQQNGAVWLTSLDVETALRPILFPPRNRAGAGIKTICLDPGHGGKDPGFCVGSNQEKKYTLLLAQELRQQLSRAGFKVAMTRTSDNFIELPDRPELARQQRANLLVSLHFNATETSRESVQGAQVFCLTPAGAHSSNGGSETSGAGAFAGNLLNDKNMFLAYQMQKSLTQNLGVEDRGVRRARFWVLRDATMPAVLIEAGFMSHPKEGQKIFTAAYRRQMATAIVQGLLAYKRTVEQSS